MKFVNQVKSLEAIMWSNFHNESVHFIFYVLGSSLGSTTCIMFSNIINLILWNCDNPTQLPTQFHPIPGWGYTVTGLRHQHPPSNF